MLDIVGAAGAVRARPWLGYGVAVGLTLGALSIRLLAGDLLRGFPFLTFFSAIALAGFLGGGRAGFVAIALSAVFADYFLLPPNGFAVIWPSGAIALAGFIATGSVIVVLIRGMIRAIESKARTEAALIALNADLDARVLDRTAALSEAHTERNAAEQQVRQMQKMESIGQLTGGIAHDFNNMLAVVIGSLEMAERRITDRDPARLRFCLDNAAEAAKRAAALTARLLAFSRQQPLEPQTLDANKLVGGMSDLIRRTLGEPIRIETVLSGGLWRAFADPAQLESAILNLAVNARDAMPGGGKLTIETANADLDDRYARTHAEVEPGQYVLVSVTDTGTGMGPDVLERAFEPFYTTKDVGRGTGLGLSQVFGFVKQSGGHVKIYSEIGRGTTVKVYLPRQVGAVISRADRAVEPRIPRDEKSEAFILVAEDEEQVRLMAVEALRELGYTVIHASDGHQALARLALHPRIDLLFTDIVMPDMTGRELADTARVQRPDLKVLYMTGYTRNAVVHNGVLDQGVAFLPKPFTLDQLAQKVSDVLATGGANRA